MTNLLRLSLRARLVILVVAAVVPLFALSIYKALREAGGDVDLAKSNLQFAASLAAANQDRIADSARQILTAVANVPDLASKKSCRAYFESLRGRFPAYTNFGILELDGTVRCHSAGVPGPVVVTDRGYLAEVLKHRDFVMGGYMIGRLSGRGVYLFGMPMFDAADKVSGIVFASLDVREFARTLDPRQLPVGARLTIIDRDGIVLAAYPQGAATVGEKVADRGLAEAMRVKTTGVHEGVDTSGRARIYAFSPGLGAASGALFASVSIDREQITGPGQELLRFEMLLLALGAVLGGMIAWSIAGRAIVEPTRQILDATRRLQDGDLDVRVTIKRQQAGGEFVNIADGFNLMASSLQQRQDDLETELVRSRQAYSTLELVLNSMQEGLIAADVVGRFLLFNEAAARIFPRDEPLGRAAGQRPQRMGLFRPGTDTLYLADELPIHRALQGESRNDFDILVRNALVPEGRQVRASYRPMMNEDRIVGALVVFTDVTEVQRLERDQALHYAELRETQVRLVEAQRIGHIGNWEIGFATRRFQCSDGLYDMMGLDSAFEGSFSAMARRVHPEDRARFEAMRDVAVHAGNTLDLQVRIVRPDGQVRWMHCLGEVRTDAQGRPEAFVGVAQDVTERQMAALALQESEERFRTLFAGAATGISMTDAAGRFIQANPAYCEMTGYSEDELRSLTIHDITFPEDAPLTRELSDRLMAGGIDNFVVERRYLRKDGGVKWGRASVSAVLRASERRPASVVAVTEDITAQRESQAQLADSEQRYAALFDAAPVPMWVFDAQTLRFLTVNDAALASYGYTREEFLSMTPLDIRSQAEQERFRHIQEAGLQDAPGEWLHLRRDGTEFPVAAISRAIQYAGRPAHFVLALDVTARVSAEKEAAEYLFMLQRSADAAQAIVQRQTLAGTLQELADQARAVIRTHHAVVSLVGAAPVESLSEKSDEPHDDAELIAPLVGRDGGTLGELRLSGKFEGGFTPRDQYGAVELAQLASIAIDNARLFDQIQQFNQSLEQKVAERTRALELQQAALRQSNHELEVFSYAVSHDLRAPLNTVDGFSRLLARQVGEQGDGKTRHYIARIQAGVGQMGQQIDGLLSLAQVSRMQLRPEAVDLTSIAREILARHQATDPQREAAFAVAEGMAAQGDRRLLRVVLENLLGNAWKFTSRMPRTDVTMGVRDGAQSGEEAFFVRDNGTGFDMAYADKLFTTFQRLHAVTEFPGTGIGLATASRIVNRHGGRIWAESRPGEGATFFFTLPQAPSRRRD